jgi:CheY-like chemotaxis protein
LISSTDSKTVLPKDSNIEPYENARRLSILRRQRKVLIVDDESTGRTILAKIIQQAEEEVSVDSFDNPLEALQWLDHNHPDLIITDYRMPEINGVELIKQIRNKPACQDIPIMMITVVSEKSVRYDALEAGATAFLTRPIDQIECRTSCRNPCSSYTNSNPLFRIGLTGWLARSKWRPSKSFHENTKPCCGWQKRANIATKSPAITWCAWQSIRVK